jgi:Flp pilus assembly pilin Flp
MFPWSRAAWRFVKDDTGATMVEYSLLLGLVAAVCVSAVTSFGSAVSKCLGSATSSLSGGTGTGQGPGPRQGGQGSGAKG